MKLDRFEMEVQRNKRRKTWRSALIAIVVVVVPFAAAGYFLGRGKQGQELRDFVGDIGKVWASPDLIFSRGDRVNVAFIGVDANYDRGGMPYTKHSRSDTILLVDFDRLSKQMSAVSIPRDTLAAIPGHGVTKINAANAFGGPELLLQTLRESLGIEADYYIKVRFAGFEKAVDAVGGVDLDVEKDMNYDDDWAHIHIHLHKGLQHLDGQKAHGYVRFRHDAMGDIGRVARQQKLMKALAKKMLSPTMVTRIPRLIRVFQEFVETNMTTAQMMSLAAFARSLNPETIQTDTLPGSPLGGEWVADRTKGAEVLVRVLGSSFDTSLWASRHARGMGRTRSSRPSAQGHATEPPLEPTARIPEPSISQDREATPDASSQKEPIVISPAEEGQENPPKKAKGPKEQPGNVGKPSPAIEGKARGSAEAGSRNTAGSSKSGASGKTPTGPKPEPPSIVTDRNIPPPATDDNP